MNAQNVGEILDALAARFGATGAHLWVVLQHQAKVELLMGIVGCIIAGSLCYLTVRLLQRGTEIAADKDAPYDAEAVWFICGGVIGAAALVATIIAISQLCTGIAAAANPEYFALKQVLAAFK